MSTQEIATKLKVSRTPVREAFLRLQREGLVETIPQRETMVSLIDLKRVEKERFIRESLELAVIDQFLEHCNQSHFNMLREKIAEQRQCWREKRYADFVNCDNMWHKIIFEAAEQDLAWETLMNVNGHYNRIRVLTVQVEKTTEGVIQQHSKIVDLLEQGRANDVRAEMTDHLTKLNVEKLNLVRIFPNYFKTSDEPNGIQLGSL